MCVLYISLQVHSQCREQLPKKCPFSQCRVSILPPTAINSMDSDGYWEAMRPPGTSPLLVFVNTKSGDNQVSSCIIWRIFEDFPVCSTFISLSHSHIFTRGCNA